MDLKEKNGYERKNNRLGRKVLDLKEKRTEK